MSAQERRYRIRFAERGAEEITEDTVEFTLDLTTLYGIPVVRGSVAHPIQGANEMSPFLVEAIDEDGALTVLMTTEKTVYFDFLTDVPEGPAVGRWDIVGRMIDLQWQGTDEDEFSPSEWITYGTGRCSGFDEKDGQGKYRIEISDESWKARKHKEVFEFADTASLWPPGVLRNWRRSRQVRPATVIDISPGPGDLTRVTLRAGCYAHPQQNLGVSSSRAIISDGLKRFLKEDLREELNFASAGTTDEVPGNFVHTRLLFGAGLSDSSGTSEFTASYEIVSFGGLDEEEIFSELENPLMTTTYSQTDSSVEAFFFDIRVYVRNFPISAPFPEPIGDGVGALLWAPTSPPSKALPLHIGMTNVGYYFSLGGAAIDHPWGVQPDPSEGLAGGLGGIHVADLHRRVWDIMELRYDPANLTQIEADSSFPLLYPRITDEEAENPEEWLETVRQAVGLISLRDSRGRLKLVDMRPVREIDFDSLDTVDASNSEQLTWGMLGRELINRIIVEYDHIEEPTEFTLTKFAGVGNQGRSVGSVDPPPGVEFLDGLVTLQKQLGPYDGDTIEDSGERPFSFQGQTLLLEAPLESDEGEPAETRLRLLNLLAGWLELYQDGLQRFEFELGKTLADEIEEGTLVVLDHASLQIPNPRTQARSGERVIRIVSITRFPAYAEIEAILLPTRDVPEIQVCEAVS